MKLKLFGAKRSCGYCGGLIIVAANTIEEAYQTYKDWVKETNNSHLVYEEWGDIDGVNEIYNHYPFKNWYSIDPKITVECDKPMVIDEDGYTE